MPRGAPIHGAVAPLHGDRRRKALPAKWLHAAGDVVVLIGPHGAVVAHRQQYLGGLLFGPPVAAVTHVFTTSHAGCPGARAPDNSGPPRCWPSERAARRDRSWTDACGSTGALEVDGWMGSSGSEGGVSRRWKLLMTEYGVGMMSVERERGVRREPCEVSDVLRLMGSCFDLERTGCRLSRSHEPLELC